MTHEVSDLRDLLPEPYYADGLVTLYHADCRDVLPALFGMKLALAVVTDPPYPNTAGYFDESVQVARDVLAGFNCETVTFWSELEKPPVPLPLVGVHIWHRANVNGRPYEPAYHFCPSGAKRRSDVFRHAVEFENATGAEYLGHPTQKPVALMQELIFKTVSPIVLDPFAGVGSTLRAAKNLGLRVFGVEVDERYCEIAAKRCAQEVLETGAALRDVQQGKPLVLWAWRNSGL